MAVPIPDRFRLEMRLGRDGDIEEWLATDTSLQRPVLVRSLGPESSTSRRAGFVDAVAMASKVTHPHLARVFAVAQVDGGAYSISEWTGGVSVADHLDAAQPFNLQEFLPNATGLSAALAELHKAGALHGAIDTSAIAYSVVHPARLMRMGRRPTVTDPEGDVIALSEALETTLTGAPPGGPPPSESIDGIPRAIDRILRHGQRGLYSAEGLEKALRSAPTPRALVPQPASSWRRPLWLALGLLLASIGLVGLGLLFSDRPPIIQVSPTATSPPPATPTTSSPPSTVVEGRPEIVSVEAFDPFGEGGENNDDANNTVDSDTFTLWRTERYQDPLPLLKKGVGLLVAVSGNPATLELVGLSSGTSFEIYWSATRPDSPDEMERLIAAVANPGSSTMNLPPRPNGFWLVWLTDLPLQPDGTFFTTVAELVFVS